MGVTRTPLQRLVAEQDKHYAAGDALSDRIDAEIVRRVEAGEAPADIAREIGKPRQNVNRRIQRHKARKGIS